MEEFSIKLENDHVEASDTSEEKTDLFASLLAPNVDHLDPAVELRQKLCGKGKRASIEGSRSSRRTAELDEAMAQLAPHLPAHITTNQVRSRFKAARSSFSSNMQKHRANINVNNASFLIPPNPKWGIINTASIGLFSQQQFPATINDSIAESSHPKVYALVPTPQYDELFEEFTNIVEMGDIHLLVEFTRKHPYMVDALLIISDWIRMSSVSDASELVERSIHILEKALRFNREKSPTHISIPPNLISGNQRLPYDEFFDNRRIHLALFRHIQFLTRKGCFRTALEMSKILWSLDPYTDPMGVRLIVDYLAIQSGELEWFEEFWHCLTATEISDNVDTDDHCCPIDKLSPCIIANWYYSKALIELKKKKNVKKKDPSSSSFSSNNNIIEFLVEAIKKFPWMIPKLAFACGLQLDEDNWRKAFPAEYILLSNDEMDHVRVMMEAMAKIYAARTGPIWKEAVACSLLEEAIGIVLSLKQNDIITSQSFECSSSVNSSSDLLHITIYKVLPVLRHTILSDLKDVNVVMPKSIISPGEAIQLYDPLSPDEFIHFGEKKRTVINTINCNIM